MKKLTLALSIACAGALAFADTEQWQTSWFTGIGSDVTAVTDLKATNGSWGNLTTDNAEIADNALVLDLDSDDEATFTVANAAEDSKTAQKISVTGVFTPIASSELPSADDMGSSGKNAQLGFAVVATTTTSADDDSSTTTTYSYQAWVGGSDWVMLGTCADKDATTDLTITFAYWDSSVTATFAIKNGDTDVTFGDDATTKTLELSDNALTVATANYKVSSVACTGSGTLSALSGDAQYAVATLNGRNYGTVADAITAAGTSGNTITLVKDPSGDVTIAAGATVKIDENGKTASIENNGSMTIPLTETQVNTGNTTFDITVKGNKPEVTTTDESKECIVSDIVNGKATVTVQTKTSILNEVKFNNVNLMKSETNFRKFMTDNGIAAYTGKGATAAAIQTALNENEEGNELKKWQCYALGISPSTTLKTAYADADSGNTIKIALAPSAAAESIVSSGDFTIKYQVTDGSSTTTATSADAIQVPLETGRYTVNVVFSAPEGN